MSHFDAGLTRTSAPGCGQKVQIPLGVPQLMRGPWVTPSLATATIPIALGKLTQTITRHVDLNIAAIAKHDFIRGMPPVGHALSAHVADIGVDGFLPELGHLLRRRRWHFTPRSRLVREILQLTRFDGFAIQCLVRQNMQRPRVRPASLVAWPALQTRVRDRAICGALFY